VDERIGHALERTTAVLLLKPVRGDNPGDAAHL